MIKLNHMALCTGSVGVVCDKVNLLFSENADGLDMVTFNVLEASRAGEKQCVHGATGSRDTCRSCVFKPVKPLTYQTW